MRRLNSRYIIGPMTDTPVLADTASFKHAVDPARIVALLANELNVRATQVAATVELLARSEERREGNECVITCGSWWSPNNLTQNIVHKNAKPANLQSTIPT